MKNTQMGLKVIPLILELLRNYIKTLEVLTQDQGRIDQQSPYKSLLSSAINLETPLSLLIDVTEREILREIQEVFVCLTEEYTTFTGMIVVLRDGTDSELARRLAFLETFSGASNQILVTTFDELKAVSNLNVGKYFEARKVELQALKAQLKKF